MTKAKFREIIFGCIYLSLYVLYMTLLCLIIEVLLKVKGVPVNTLYMVFLGAGLSAVILSYPRYIKRLRKLIRVQEESVPPSISAINEYLEVKKQHKDNEERLIDQKFVAVKDYAMVVLSPYMKEADVITVCDNIHAWVSSEEKKLKAVSTDGRLASIDLRHFAWNVGERFGWNGEKRALFIKMVFPVEMKDIEVATIRRNLRQVRSCIIDLDIPEKGEYQFTFKVKDKE